MKKFEVLDFYAEWCGPCRAMSPTIAKLMEEMNVEGSEVEIKKVDVDKDPELTSKFGIRSIPTLIFLKEGEEAERLNGAVSRDKILKTLEQIAA